MPFSIGINFRATSGYVTDPGGYTYCIGDTFPVTRGGATFGWTQIAQLGTRNRNASEGNVRVAGINFNANSTSPISSFTLTLPAAGAYQIGLAMGDATNGQTQYFDLYDNATLLTSQSGVNTNADQFMDIAGNVYSTGNTWFTNQVMNTYMFASTSLILTIANPSVGGNSSTLACLIVAASGGAVISDGTDDTLPRAPGLRLWTPFSRLRASVIDSTDSNVTAILTGNAAAFTAGTLIDTHSKALTGQSALFTPGSLSHADSEPLTGQKATFSAGSVSPSISKALTGASASFSAGTVTAVLPLVAPLSGVVLVSTGGSLKAAATKALSGQSAALTAGTLAPASAEALLGQGARFTAGTMAVPGNVTASLTGASAVFAAGTILVPGTFKPAGDSRRRYGVRDGWRLLVFDTQKEADRAKAIIQARDAPKPQPRKIKARAAKPLPPHKSLELQPLERSAARYDMLQPYQDALRNLDSGILEALGDEFDRREQQEQREQEQHREQEENERREHEQLMQREEEEIAITLINHIRREERDVIQQMLAIGETSLARMRRKK